MNRVSAGLIAGLALAVVVLGCGREKEAVPVVTPEPPPVSFMEKPAAFGAPRYGTVEYPVTEAGFRLGKALFFDPALSDDSSVSCATCHLPEAAFAHPGEAVSHGILSRPGTRNSPAIQNLAWRTNFMWDGGVNHLELQPINPIQNPAEMGHDFAATVAKVAALPRYRPLTQAAYGTDTLTSQRFLKGMAQFMATLVSAHSPYDRYMAGDATALTPLQVQGLGVFRDKGCGDCHTPPLFTDQQYRNNGLSEFFHDKGRAVITNNPADEGKFLVPSLRNVAVTAPYMHDGRMPGLRDVLIHYQGNVLASPTLDPRLQPPGVGLNEADMDALEAFFEALTDSAFLGDVRFRE